MVITELGYKWPCQTEGILVDLEQVEPQAGEIAEFYFECDRDITTQEAARAVFDLMKVKEEYPGSVLHYVNIEPRRITIQYSVAPVGGHASPLAWYWIAVIIVGLFLAVFLPVIAVKNGWIFGPKPTTGELSVSAVGCSDEQCTSPEALDVTFSVAGKTYRTKGGTVLIELQVGSYDIIPGDPPEGYQPADPVTITIAKDQTITIRLKYYEEGVIPPDVAWLVIDTYPVKGLVYINGEEIGEAVVVVKVFPLTTYIVSFGDVSGYDTPTSQTHSLQREERRGVNGTYVRVGWPEWVKWAAIGGGVLVGGLIIVKTAELILARRQ